MHNVWTLLQREYLERVRSRSFVIFTLLMPAFMAGSVLIPAKLAEMNTGGVRHLVLVVNHAQIATAVMQELGTSKPQASTCRMRTCWHQQPTSSRSIPRPPTPSEWRCVSR
jgi:ABC-2 type transport system permease protein